MGTLFSQAAGVVVWLGPAADGSDRAMEIAQRWGSQVDYNLWTDTIQPSTRLIPGARDEKMADMNTPLNCNGTDSLTDSFVANGSFDPGYVKR